MLVAFDCNPSLTHAVRPGRLVPVFAPPAPAEAEAQPGGGGSDSGCGGSEPGECRSSTGASASAAVVCASTDTYRRLARSQVTKRDAVLEIGCSAGGASALLAQHAGRVVGVDNSQELIRTVSKGGACT